MVAASALHGSPASAEIRTDIARRRSMALASFRERIEQGKRDGDVAADVDAAALAEFYMAVLEGLTVHARDGASVDRLLGIVGTAMKAWPD
jgi:TetR/AcrR family transcriptional regulator, copper-responsive repressor